MKTTPYILTIQGLYYVLTSLWSIVWLESFHMIVWQKTYGVHVDFLTQTVGILFLVIGATIIVYKNNNFAIKLALFTALATAIIEMIYWNHINMSLLKYDLIVQILLSIYLIIQLQKNV